MIPFIRKLFLPERPALLLQGLKSLGLGALCTRCGVRNISSNEIAVALRPFFFSVHPDLFGKFPDARAVNEDSMKQLNNYLESLQRRSLPPLTLKFFMRNREAVGLDPKIFAIEVQLKGADAKTELSNLLRTCNLSTDYVESLTSSVSRPSHYGPGGPGASGASAWGADQRYERHMRSTEGGAIFEEEVPFFKRKSRRVTSNLASWLKVNGDKAKMYQMECKPVRAEIQRISWLLRQEYGIEATTWSAEWNQAQCLGSFRSLQRILSDTPHSATYLRGRRIVFSSRTGVNADGHILLSPKDVPQNWAHALQTFNTYQTIISSHIPKLESRLSELLSDIQVAYRKNQQEMLAEEYHRQLQKMVSMLEAYYAKGFPLPRDSYDDLQLVVEGDSAPLTLSPPGQFLAPAVAPASILLPYIAEHQDRAARLLSSYSFVHREMSQVVARCRRLFSLDSLTKDDSVSGEQMIECCQRLAKNFHDIYIHLPVGSRVTVTSYYSVLQSGEICIPWNWKMDDCDGG